MTNKESQTIEFKQNWRDEHLKVLCSFTNTDGGELILGMDDSGTPIGLRNARKLLEDLPNKITSKLGIIPSVTVQSIAGKEIVRVTILPSSLPVPYDGKYYIRSGSTTQELKGGELSRFLLKKMGKTWDSLPCRASLSDLNTSTIEDFKQLAGNRIPGISTMDSPEKVLSNLNLITEDGALTNAAVLLFGKKSLKVILHPEIRVGRFKQPSEITDTVIINGNLFERVEQVVAAVKKHLSVQYDIKDTQRKDIWEYPLAALREAIINALVHRDYSNPAEIQVKIYDDKIWIWNPGPLPPELYIDDLKKEHASFPRNPLLANAFYLAGFIERWGSGTLRIVELCQTHGLPEPEYLEEQGGFSIRLFKDRYTETYLKTLGLNDRQIKAVAYIKAKGRITNTEYQQLTGASKPMASIDLKGLVEKKVVVRVGKTGKGTGYVLQEGKG